MSDEPVSEGIIDTSINESFSASERRRQKKESVDKRIKL